MGCDSQRCGQAGASRNNAVKLQSCYLGVAGPWGRKAGIAGTGRGRCVEPTALTVKGYPSPRQSYRKGSRD